MRIVVTTRDLEPAKLELSGIQGLIVPTPVAPESSHVYRGYSRNRLCCGDQWTEINGLAESEVIRMKKTETTVRQNAITEQLKQSLFDSGAQIIRVGARMHLDLQ